MRIQVLSPLLQHSGIDKVVELFSDESPKIYEDIARQQPFDSYFYRTATHGDLPQAGTIDEARGITFSEYRTPFYKDWTPIKFGIGWADSTEVSETDKYGIIAQYAAKMYQSLEWAREITGANFVNNATSSSFTGGDGEPLASDAHPIQGGTASNIIPGNPALSYSALETLMEIAMQVKSDAGNYMMYSGPFDLIVSPSQWGYASRILLTDGIAGTFNLDPSMVKGKFRSKVITDPYIISDIAWMVKCSDPKKHGMVMVNRRMNISKSQYDIYKDANLYTLTGIWCPAFEDWRGVWYSDGTGS